MISTSSSSERPPEPRRIIGPVKNFRDEIALSVMHQMLDKNPALARDEHFLANRSYRVADAMLAARKKES